MEKVTPIWLNYHEYRRLFPVFYGGYSPTCRKQKKIHVNPHIGWWSCHWLIDSKHCIFIHTDIFCLQIFWVTSEVMVRRLQAFTDRPHRHSTCVFWWHVWVHCCWHGPIHDPGNQWLHRICDINRWWVTLANNQRGRMGRDLERGDGYRDSWVYCLASWPPVLAQLVISSSSLFFNKQKLLPFNIHYFADMCCKKTNNHSHLKFCVVRYKAYSSSSLV